MPERLQQIAAILELKQLHPAPERDGGDMLDAVMAIKDNYPKYALDQSGHIIGLNLAQTGLTDKKWQKIIALPGLAEHLQALNLTANELTVFSFPEGGGLRKLKRLRLAENKLREFALPEGMDALTDLDLEDNPLENPGPEVLKQGKAAVLRILRELTRQGVAEIFEAKLLLVGEGDSGKTTLWNLIQDPKGYEVTSVKSSTIGVEIREGWHFPHPDTTKGRFLVNLWDFGGQDEQYMTHQFFLSRRSLYVLLANARGGDPNFPYWLKTISLFGCDENDVEGGSRMPVLVVLNQKGSVSGMLPYDPATVEEEYPKIKLIKHELDLAKKGKRLDVLLEDIKDLLCGMPHLPIRFPANWAAVRAELNRRREAGENHLDAESFARICEDNQVTDLQSRDDLSSWLHDLGVILHFHENATLEDFIIINPQWAANAVYKIMEYAEIRERNRGRFDGQFLKTVWDKAGFSLAEQTKLEKLMTKDLFEVCFSAREQGRTIYIAPQLLPAQQPEVFEWKPAGSQLGYIYVYPFMPIGIVGHLFVQINEDIETIRGEKVVWKHGAVLDKDGCRALILERNDGADGRKTIRIQVQGNNTERGRHVLQHVISALQKIHRERYPTLRYFEKIPCICSVCAQSAVQHEHDLGLLRRLEANRGSTILCDISLEQVSVKQLLKSVFPENTGLADGDKSARHRAKKIFFSYSKNDRAFLEQFLKHLAPLKLNDNIQTWNDADILAGAEWDTQIRQELREADIIILLVSADFLATPYIQSVEIKTAMERHRQGEAVVIPVILRACKWESMLGELSGLPFKGQPVASWPDRDAAWLAVVDGIEKRIEAFTR